MSDIQVSIRKAGAGRAVSPGQSALASGDKLTFTAAHDAASILCFSAETAALLSAKSQLDLAGGASISFTVGTAQPKEYIAIVQAHGWPAPSSVPAGKSSASARLTLRDAGGKDFPDPPDPPVNTGNDGN